MITNRLIRRAGTMLFTACFLFSAVYAANGDIALPKPKASLNTDVMKAFQERHSSRAFSKKEVPADAAAALLWAGYGTNRPGGKRTVPSAHGDDLLDLYALTDKGVYYYDPDAHVLKLVSAENIKGKIARQGFVANAPLVVVLVGKMKTGSDETEMNYIHFTAGCAAENMYLAAGSLGLGTVVIAWIHPDALTKGLRLKKGQVPLYIMPFGYPG